MLRKKLIIAILLLGWLISGRFLAFAENTAPLELKTVIESGRSLRLGLKGPDVGALQKFLARDKEIYPEGLITGYFGKLTEMAVKRWQSNYKIEPVGMVGPKTRAKLKEILEAQPPASATPTEKVQLPQDTVAPVVDEESIRVTSITSTSAIISWNTDELSDSAVRFTDDAPCKTSITTDFCAVYSASDSVKTTIGHRIVVSGLLYQTAYYFNVNSTDTAGNKSANGAVKSFNTLSSEASPLLPDLKIEPINIAPASPVVNQLATASFRITNASRLTKTSNFVLSFIVGSGEGASDISAGIDNDVEFRNVRHDCFGDFPAFGSCNVQFDLIYKTAGQKVFRVTLDPSNVISEDNKTNNVLFILPFQVTELASGDTTPPEITLSISSPESTRAFVKFNANEESLVEYEYGLKSDYSMNRKPWNLYWAKNEAYLENLTPSTTYHVRAKAKDRSGNTSYSQDYNFTTSASTPKPNIISGPSISGQTVSWTNNAACDGKVSYGLTLENYGNSVKDTNVANHQITLANLVPGTTYHYRISCTNDGGTVESVDRTFITGRTTSAIHKNKLASVLELLANILTKLLSWLW
ncbi:MAG: fibronectin type III domain-containing protein [Patescibacteria group bacterium]